MNNEILNSKYEYFLGRTANLNDYARKGCEYFDEHDTKKWKRCYDVASVTRDLKPFLPDTKYRRLKPPGSITAQDHQ